MYCKNCGKEIANDSTFCSYCGAKQEKGNNPKQIEIPKIVFNNSLSRKKKIFLGIYLIYLFIIALICISEGNLYDDQVAVAIFYSALPLLVVLVKNIYKWIFKK